MRAPLGKNPIVGSPHSRNSPKGSSKSATNASSASGGVAPATKA